MSGTTRVLRGARALLPKPSDYRAMPRTWRGDVLAGITVGIVALPLALGFGVTSGAGAEAGLVTAIVAGVVAAIFGGSAVQVSGPTGAMVVVLAPIVAAHGVAAVPIVSIMAGALVLVAGAARLGRAVAMIPWPVIEGFTLGIAVTIFLQQIPGAVDATGTHSSNAAIAAVQSLAGSRWPDALWPLGTVAAVAVVMLLLPRITTAVPAGVVAIALITVAAVVIGAPLARIGVLPAALPAPRIPAFDLATLTALAPAALTVAALAAIESLLSARVASTMAPTGRFDADRELVGQGLASIAAGLFGGMPATGAIARTAVNVRSGGRSRLAAVVHAVLLLVIVLVGAQIVALVPLAALAGVLMVTAARMVSRATVHSVLSSSKSDATVFIATAVITVSFDLIFAVAIGIAVAAVFALRSLASASGVHREPIEGPQQPGDSRIAVFRVDGSLIFAAADRVLTKVALTEHVSVVILRLSQVQLIDASGARVLVEVTDELERRGVTVLIKGVRPEHLHLIEQVGVLASLRHPNHLFETLEPAIEHAREHVAREIAV